MRTIAQIFVAYSEKLTFTVLQRCFYQKDNKTFGAISKSTLFHIKYMYE